MENSSLTHPLVPKFRHGGRPSHLVFPLLFMHIHPAAGDAMFVPAIARDTHLLQSIELESQPRPCKIVQEEINQKPKL